MNFLFSLLLAFVTPNEIVPLERFPLDELTCSGIGKAVTAHGVTVILGVNPGNSPSYTSVYGYDWKKKEAWEHEDLRVNAWFLGGITSTDQGFLIFDNLSGFATYLDKGGRFVKRTSWRDFTTVRAFLILHDPWPYGTNKFFATGDAGDKLHGTIIDISDRKISILEKSKIENSGDRFIPLESKWLMYNVFTKYIAILDNKLNLEKAIHLPSEMIKAKNRSSRFKRKIGNNLQVIKTPVMCENFITWNMRIKNDIDTGLRFNIKTNKIVETNLIPVGYMNGKYLVFDLAIDELRIVSRNTLK